MTIQFFRWKGSEKLRDGDLGAFFVSWGVVLCLFGRWKLRALVVSLQKLQHWISRHRSTTWSPAQSQTIRVVILRPSLWHSFTGHAVWLARAELFAWFASSNNDGFGKLKKKTEVHYCNLFLAPSLGKRHCSSPESISLQRCTSSINPSLSLLRWCRTPLCSSRRYPTYGVSNESSPIVNEKPTGCSQWFLGSSDERIDTSYDDQVAS